MRQVALSLLSHVSDWETLKDRVVSMGGERAASSAEQLAISKISLSAVRHRPMGNHAKQLAMP